MKVKQTQLLNVFPTGLSSALLGILIAFTTSICAVNAKETKGTNPIKTKEKIFEAAPVPNNSFSPEDIRNLGKKGYIYPYSETIENTNGDFIYEDYAFTDFAMENNDRPNENTQFATGQLEKNLTVETQKEGNGVTSWTITFYPNGVIYNKPSDLKRFHHLDNAVAGVAFTKDIEILNGNAILVETYDTETGAKIGTKTIYPGGKNGLNETISDAKKAEYTLDATRTGKLFFGEYYGEKDPINLRAGSLKSVANNSYKRLFDKSFVFESRNTYNKKWVITFKTKENYAARETLNVFRDTKQKIQENSSHYISGVMAGIGSYQDARTVSGVNFIGNRLSDKFIYTETIDVNETFLTNQNTITVPPRTITFDKAVSRYQYTNKPIDYSVSINKAFAMPHGEQLSGNIKKTTTKYILVDYEKYDPNTAIYGRYTNKHSIFRELETLTESMTPIPGYTTTFAEEPIHHRYLAINVTHRANDYSSPEDEIKIGLDDLTKNIKQFINDYPVGVGHVEVQKSTNENLDNVPTQAQLDELKAKQDEIKAKIAKIKAFIEKNSSVLGNKKAEYNKLIDAYENVFNGLNNQSVKEYEPNYEDIKNNLSTNINSPEYNKKYSDIIKELNEAAMAKLKENTSYNTMRDEAMIGGQILRSPRYKSASDKRKAEFKNAFDTFYSLFRKKFPAGQPYGDATLAEVLEAKRALNEAIINLDRPDAPPVLTAPREGDTSVTATIPPASRVGDEIKIYRFENGNYIEIGSYTLTQADLSKSSVEVPLNPDVTLTEGETVVGRTYRDYLGTENSAPVVVEEVLICTQNPMRGKALNTKVGISTLNRGSDNWNLNGLGAYLALESNTKGFVITRNEDPENNIQNPVEGMLVFDTTAKCLKLYSSKTGTAQWNCIKQGCNHK